jgi:threonine 3-dehydrogenase
MPTAPVRDPEAQTEPPTAESALPSTMWALTFDRARESWDSSTGLVKERVPVPRLDDPSGADAGMVLLRVIYAGFCGSDRGIWWRKAFGDMILGSLEAEGQSKRIVGHELLGQVVAAGDAVPVRLRPGAVVSTESHIVCDACPQCLAGQQHVCADDRIIGISRDGCFAEYVKLPAKALWPTDLGRIRPEVGAVQEPFGNAVHACQVAPLKGATVAIIGCGTIGLFAILVARGMGAKRILGVELDPRHAEMARQLGCEVVLTPGAPPADRPWASDPELVARVKALTDGHGADVVMEMAGFNSSLNNALRMVRRGGHVVLFGVKNGDVQIEDYHRLIMNGIQLHGVVGRQLFSTWEHTQALLEDTGNGVQQAVWDVILNGGQGTMSDIDTWEAGAFEAQIRANPKVLIRFGPPPA